MGNKTTMWFERTHKIRRTPLDSKRESPVPVFLSLLSPVSSPLSFLSPFPPQPLYISILFVSHLVFKGAWLCPLTGHAGGTVVLPMAHDRKPIWDRRPLSFSQDYIGVTNRCTSCIKHRNLTNSVYIDRKYKTFCDNLFRYLSQLSQHARKKIQTRYIIYCQTI